MARRWTWLIMGIAVSLYCSMQSDAFAQTALSPENQAEFAKLLEVQNTQRSLSLESFMPPRAAETKLERLLLWSNIALEATALDHTPVEPGSGDDPRRFAERIGPHRSSYAMAIVHIAMFEAVNSVYQKYESYTGLRKSDPALAASPVFLEMAIGQAAHDALLAMYPYQKDRLDSQFSVYIARLPKPPSGAGNATLKEKLEKELQAGEELGRDAAQSILQKRLNDGADRKELAYGSGFVPNQCDVSPNPCPGVWSPDPDPENKLTVALGAEWSKVRPFVIESASQFRPLPPPALDSADYARAFNEVAKVGAKNAEAAGDRRDYQTFEGYFWAYDGTPALCAPPRLYNQVADTVALQQRMGDVADFSRYLALVNTAMADAAISAWEAKYHYQLWRPVTAIRAADRDGNPDTQQDPNWLPLAAPATNARGPNFTPPFPAYPSGHAVFGGTVFGMLRHFWDDATPFVLVSDEYNGLNYPVGGTEPRAKLPQSFVSFSHAEYANGRSRIWLGIHWQFDADAGIEQGNKIADYVFAHAFQPVAN
ncbi:vanadium-dependent haloperoxidase [Dongia rigui]|uniref:Vanadium-dependent haloperoxidase n=1 Tax=Dongia rigui TaxID=940149 RepID=A0ABU5E1N8_9PROT|nr:vanadium-dependent haloperoxidase [Dongia rigui]MDY0872823.1 vanadium-dependent haloperoxidase [Dongia rigui]